MREEMADNDIYARIKGLAARHTGVREAKLTPQTRLVQDLGMAGDDAAEFLAAYGEAFGVDTTGFHFGEHFGQEAAFNPFIYLWQALFDRKKLHLIAITLAGLTSSARAKRWIRPAG